jgi:cyclase
MLRKRIIFTLIYSNGFFMQSRNFRLQKVGDINWIEKNYNLKEIAFSLDELIVLDASECKDIVAFSKVLNRLANNVFIPITAGGGIRTMQDAKILFENGADKILLNTVLHSNPSLVASLIDKYGSQSVVASIDYKNNKVFIKDGNTKISLDVDESVKYVENLGAGEIYLNSIDRDGTGFGYDIDMVSKVANSISIPLVIAGGSGNGGHFIEGLIIDGVSATATANLLNFIGNGFFEARKRALNAKCNVAE